MNSISRNKYIDKSATLLKAYFTLASCCGRAQTTRARVCVRACARPFSDEEAYIQSRTRDKERERSVYEYATREMNGGGIEKRRYMYIRGVCEVSG